MIITMKRKQGRFHIPAIFRIAKFDTPGRYGP